MRCRSSLAGLPCLFEISSSDQMRSGARTSPMRGMPVIAERLNLVVLNLKGAVPLVAANRYSSDPGLARRWRLRCGCLHPFNFTRSPLRKTIIYVVTLIAARQNMRSPRSSGEGKEEGKRRRDRDLRRRIPVHRPSFVRATCFGADSAARPLRRRRDPPME